LKQFAAISLLLLLCFNWFGYRLLSGILQQKADTRLEAKLDKEQYDPAQLIELRIPINLPYHNDWDQFERYNGEIILNGVHYKYVKRKVEKGELVLLCLPNNEKQMLASARDQFFKLVNDIQQNPTGSTSEKGNPSTVKNLLSEYQRELNEWVIASAEKPAVTYSLFPPLQLSYLHTDTPENPPEFFSAI
jgi:hypothetical protein